MTQKLRFSHAARELLTRRRQIVTALPLWGRGMTFGLDHARMAMAGDRATGEAFIARALDIVRTHLRLQVAYVSEFVGNESVFRVVDAPGLGHLAKAGDRRSLDDVYCRHILAGELPQLIPNTADEPICMRMPITAAVPIGAHVSVPLTMPDGECYGMFCCLGPQADPTLNERDLALMRAFADLTAFEIARERHATTEVSARRGRIAHVIERDTLDIVYQPIWSLNDERPVGYESLARFRDGGHSPDVWFSEASAVGLGVELELLAIGKALSALARIAAPTYVAVNASPAVVIDPRLALLLEHWPLERIVLEVTEHQCIDDYAQVSQALAPLRAQGLRVAVDDAGSGYSGLQQILELKPDFIKLDRMLIQDIGADPGKTALAAALRMFASDIGSRIVAEGVETERELAILRGLGVHNLQGYLLGRPQTLASIVGPEPILRRVA
jgi:EAL domain-containing protein (putative c-di-GMP-specific phosphodiesterase class I)